MQVTALNYLNRCLMKKIDYRKEIDMNIFLGIMATIILLLLEQEKNDCKRIELRKCFIAVISVIGLITVVNIITLFL